MKKKKVLFVMESLRIGGAEKSLLTILNLIDYDKYDIDLFLFRHSGEFFNMIPDKVNLLNESKNYRLFSDNRKLSPIRFLFRLDFKNFYHSFRWLIKALGSRIKNKNLFIGWEDIKYFFDDLDNNYDTAIAFLERKTFYFTKDKVKAKNMIGFIHNDYSIYPYDDKLDRYYFKYYNKIATVSDHCKDVLTDLFPEDKNKFLVIKNMVSKNLIEQLSKEKLTNYKLDKNSINIISVGRLVKQKGFDRAIEICKKLIDDGININWYVIGDGEERKNLENAIKNYKLENDFFLVGSDTNPYKWIEQADIYVQPSRFEGYGITVAEAKVLNKPIVASLIPEFKELLNNDKGLLANDIDEFVKSIKLLINDNELKNKLVNNLKKEKVSLEELDKLYEII